MGNYRILVGGYNHNIGEKAIVNDESEQLGTFSNAEEAEKNAEAEGLTEYRIGKVVDTHKIPTLRKKPARTTRDVVEILVIHTEEPVDTKKYEVTLTNNHVIFDSADFRTFEDALEWSLGRGTHYTATILCEVQNTSWHFAVNGESVLALNPFSREWHFIKKENVKTECSTVLDPEYM